MGIPGASPPFDRMSPPQEAAGQVASVGIVGDGEGTFSDIHTSVGNEPQAALEDGGGTGGDGRTPQLQETTQSLAYGGQQQQQYQFSGAVPIAKLPQTRKFSSTARGNMNCSSCRKRKIKCSRMRPSCNSCDILGVECLYDAVPKKRGPKTEVLEELLKRIDGLEKRLETESGGARNSIDEGMGASKVATGKDSSASPAGSEDKMMDYDGYSPAAATADSRFAGEASATPLLVGGSAFMLAESPDMLPIPPSTMINSSTMSASTMSILVKHAKIDDPELITHLIDVYFAKVNGKPYPVFHEATFRREWKERRLPDYVINAICAVSVHYVNGVSPEEAHDYTSRFAALARSLVDADEPTLSNLQTLLLLSLTYYSLGQGKKAFMQMGSAIRMTHALDLHLEIPQKHSVTVLEREIRRRVFWVAYVMDRFTVCGSLRPPSFSDHSIHLRLPCAEDSFVAGNPQEGPWFQENGQQLYGQVSNNHAMLIDVVRILGKTIRYMQSGGVKGDSHFPWHSQSHLSRIRGELKTWVAAVDIRSPITWGSDSTWVFLARHVYHVIHCFIFRNFLPIDLRDLEGSGPQVAWQTEAIKISFRHAFAIVDMIEAASMNSSVEWPAFASFALQVAGTVLVHGCFYQDDASKDSRAGLEKVLRQMVVLQSYWTIMRHQFVTLKRVYKAHWRLVVNYRPRKQLANTVFQLEDFFERYEGEVPFEPSHIPFFEPTDEELDLSFLNDNSSTPSGPESTTSTSPRSQRIEPQTPAPRMPQPRIPPPSLSSSSSSQPSGTPSFSYFDDSSPFFFPYSHPMIEPGFVDSSPYDVDGVGPAYISTDPDALAVDHEFGSRDPVLNILAEIAERDVRQGSKEERMDVWMHNGL